MTELSNYAVIAKIPCVIEIKKAYVGRFCILEAQNQLIINLISGRKHRGA